MIASVHTVAGRLADTRRRWLLSTLGGGVPSLRVACTTRIGEPKAGTKEKPDSNRDGNLGRL
jgi:hypothetical protein